MLRTHLLVRLISFCLHRSVYNIFWSFEPEPVPVKQFERSVSTVQPSRVTSTLSSDPDIAEDDYWKMDESAATEESFLEQEALRRQMQGLAVLPRAFPIPSGT